MRTLLITLPPVNPKLHSHNKGHWRVKAAAVKSLRTLAHGLVCEQRPGPQPTWPAAVIEYCFYVPDRRRRDEINLCQATKPAIDGIVDTGLIPDDDWTHLHTQMIRVVVDKENPRVELVLRHRAERFNGRELLELT